jgi:serine phosphatase RsbU (regulator of sigma subunit)
MIKKGLLFIAILSLDLFSYGSNIYDSVAIQYAELARTLSDSNLSRSFKYAESAIELAVINADTAALAVCWYSMGVVYHEANDFNNALDSYQKSIVFAGVCNDNYTLNLVNNNIGVIYRSQGAPEVARKYYYESLHYAESLHDTVGMIYGLSNLGSSYAAMGLYLKAESYYTKALKLAKILNTDKAQIGYIENNLGYINFLNGDCHQAILYYNRALQVFSEVNYIHGHHAVLNRIAELKLAINQYDSALFYVALADAQIDENTEISLAEETYRIYYQIYKLLNDTEQALVYYELSNTLIDSIENKDLQEYITEMQSKYELSKLEFQNELKTEQVNKQIIFIWSLCILVVLVLVIIVILVKQNIQKTFFNRLLNKQNQIISNQHHTITESIDYAAFILSKGMHNAEIPQKLCAESFVLFEPRDRVGGDFYRIINNVGASLIVVADCTGHGVAGGFLATLSNQFLEKAISEFGILSPARIIESVNQQFVKYFEGNDSSINESLDISLLLIKEDKNLVFAANRQRLWVLRVGEIIEYKGDSCYIGYQQSVTVCEHEIRAIKGDKCFLFTDGYGDQFGETSSKKLKYPAFKQLILDTADLPAAKTKEYLINAHKSWKGAVKQTDDILIVGLLF